MWKVKRLNAKTMGKLILSSKFCGVRRTTPVSGKLTLKIQIEKSLLPCLKSCNAGTLSMKSMMMIRGGHINRWAKYRAKLTETEPNDDDDARHALDDECTSKPPNSKIRNLVSFQSLSYTDAALPSSTGHLLFAKLIALFVSIVFLLCSYIRSQS